MLVQIKKLFCLTVLILSIPAVWAQKKPLEHSVYDSWQHIGEKLISNDGKWIVYTIDPQQGDNELVIQSTASKYKKSVPRGYNAVITEDSRYLVFKIKPFFKDTRDAKIKKMKPSDFPKDSLAILELGTENILKKAAVKSFKTPKESFGWLAYQLEEAKPASAKKPENNGVGLPKNKLADSLSHIIDSLQILLESRPAKKKKKDEMDATDNLNAVNKIADAEGDESGSGSSDLILRNLNTGEEKIFSNVLEYLFSKKNNQLLIEQARNPKDSGSVAKVILWDCIKGKGVVLSKSGNDFKNFTLSDDGSQVAYVAERDAAPKDLQKFYKLWYYQAGMDSAKLLADKFSVGMKLGNTISEYANLSFSKNGKRLFFGTSPIQPAKDTTLVDFEHAKLDIWHYNDDYLQTVQTYPTRLRAAQQESFLSVYDLSNNSIKQFGSKEIPVVLQTIEGDGNRLIGVTDYGKRIESQWMGTTLKDIYSIDINTGNKILVKQNLLGQLYPSPEGKYLLWYDKKLKNYFVWDGEKTRNCTEKIKQPLYREDWDEPAEPNNYGVAKWTEGDKAVLIYDRFGIWKISMDASQAPKYLLGQRDKGLRYRYISTDPDEKFIKEGQQMVFSSFNEKNKKAGLWYASFSDNMSSNLLPLQTDGDYLIGSVAKAKNSNDFIFTRESFTESPDLYHWQLTDEGPDGNRISEINPQQKTYNWGTAELFNWKAYNGKTATGIVYKPENFDPRKKYPMICYFYEKLSDGLNDYKEPAPIRSTINVPFFVSRGYIIFMPDIEYNIGHPGKSAYDYVVSGARAIVKKGWADSTKLAIQGHSWGGYQVAQLVTMTKLFKAAWSGAPVANMTSAYGGIRWESGANRQFQYEKTQSRIGGHLWNKLPLYLENSPLFHLDKVTTPMVILHNDADGAVPWYQGIELFTGLRRLGKKVWMLNYNGQGHGLTQRQDMLDYQIRMQQFFDWMLKGEKSAKWITEGVPAINKGKDWGLEIVD